MSEEQTPEPGRAVWRRQEFNHMKNRTAFIPNNAHPKHHTVLSYNIWSFARLMTAAAVPHSVRHCVAEMGSVEVHYVGMFMEHGEADQLKSVGVKMCGCE